MKHHNPYILNGSLTKGVLTLSAPIVFAMFFSSLLNIVDTFWVGKISALAVASISISWPVIFILISLAAGLSTGTTALVSRFIGAKNVTQASLTALNSFFLSLAISIVLTLIGLLTAGSLFKFLGASGEMHQMAVSYTNIIFYGTFFTMTMFILGSVLRGEGDTKTPMRIGIAINILNMILDPLFIFKFGWGINGAAVATILSSFVGMILYILHFHFGHSIIKLNFRQFKFNSDIVKETLFIGIPASLRNVANAIGVFFTMKIVAAYGAVAVAAYGISFRVESFGILPVVGIALSTTTLVGQNLGANNLQRAKLSAWASVGVSVVFTAIFSLVVYVFSSFIIQVFNSDPEVIMIGADILQIKSISFAFIFASAIMVLGSAFAGFGKSNYALVITVARVALMIGLAYWFDSIWGIVGVWWAISLTSVISGLANIIWYQLYKPKSVEILAQV